MSANTKPMYVMDVWIKSKRKERRQLNQTQRVKKKIE